MRSYSKGKHLQPAHNSATLCAAGRPTKDSSLPDIYSCFMVACIVFIGHELFVVRLSLCEANSYQFFIGSIKYVGNFSDRKLFLKNHYLNEILQTVERRAEKIENYIYRTRAIITRGLYIFYPIFIVERG